MMSQKQMRLYWREWNAVRQRMMKVHTWTGADADKFRHTLHIRALGKDVSSKALTDQQFDQILAIFRAQSHPDDVNAQVRQIDQPLTRTKRVLCDLIKELELTKPYVESMALRICKRKIDDATERDLVKLIAALNIHTRRLATAAAKSDDPF